MSQEENERMAPDPGQDAPSVPRTGMHTATTSAEIMRSDQHHDVFALCIACLVHWCAQVDWDSHEGRGDVPSPELFALNDFKTAWKSLKFSHIYAGKLKSCSAEGYMQQLYDAGFQVAEVKMAARDVERIVVALRGAGVVGDPQDETTGHTVDIDKVTSIFNEWQEVKDRLALFALWALYGAQPSHSQSHQMVLIRVEERYFDILERWTGYVESANDNRARSDLNDFVQVYASLWKQDAFCFGANLGFTPFPSQQLEEKDTDTERALVRDLRFHLSSTLRGMGVGTLERLCGEYGVALRNVLVHAEEYDDDPEHPLGIVDLQFASELKRLVDVQSQKIHCSLYGEGSEGRFFAGLGKFWSSKKPAQSAQTSVNKVMQREKARKLDIRQKKKLMEEAMGLDSNDGDGHDVLGGSEGSEGSAEDMPELMDGLEDLIPNDDAA